MNQFGTGSWKEFVRPYYLKWLYYRLFPGTKLPGPTGEPLEPWPPSQRWVQQTLAEMGSGTELPDVIFLPMTDWHSRMQRTQHLARGLAGLGHRCFLLNPHLGRELPSPPVPWRARCSISVIQSRVAELHVGLRREPVYHHRLLLPSESRTIGEALNTLCSLFGIRRAAQVLSLPVWTDVSVAIKEQFGFPIVYDCHDLLEGFQRMAPAIVEGEGALLDLADLILFSSEWLSATVCAAHPAAKAKCVLLRNGVDYSHFDIPRMRSQCRAPKQIGYVGSLDHWFDVEAVRRAAERHRDWRFPLIGRIEDERVRSLTALPNVEFRGEVPYNDIQRHLAQFDVAVIPFERTPLTLATNPIKLYEYFSVGLPVVSTVLPEVAAFPDLVYLASDPESFATQVAAAAAESDVRLAERRKEVAKAESWAARAHLMSECLSRLGPD